MVPKKFLFHTMSAITLVFALSTAGYAAETEFVTSAVYGQAEAASSENTNIEKTTAVNDLADTGYTIETVKNDTETPVAEIPETPQQQGSLPEKTIPLETTEAEEAEQTSDASSIGHAPVISTKEEAPLSQSEQVQPSTENTTDTEQKKSANIKEQVSVPPAPINGHAPVDNAPVPEESPIPEEAPVQASPITGHAPIKENVPAPEVPTVQDSPPKITIIDPVPVAAKKEAPVKGVTASSYTVKKGDTLFIIANRFSTTVSAIKSANGLKSDALYIGQTLAIPSSTNVTTYTVKKGDTLYLISKRYGTTVSAIKSANGLKSDALFVGQILKIPGKSTASNSSSGYISVTVKKGDTLYLLSKRYGTTVSAIKSANGLKSDTLMVGKVLKIPSGTAQASASNRQTSTASRYQASRSEVLLLARLIYGESRGEPYEGQVAVGAVVLNRVKSPLFPNTIAGVIYQKNEFSVVLDGQINLTPDATAIKAAEAALSGYDPTGGALFYWNPVKAPNNKFLNAKPIIARIGSHVFAK